MAAHSLPLLSPEQYLEVERASEFKSEYYNGRMYAMSGGLLTHSLLSVQIAATLNPLFRGRCRVANSDLRVSVSSRGPFFYPDLTIYCGKPQLADDRKDMLSNPIVLFEILSKSSEAYDRGPKFDAYRKIESLQEYVLVSQTEPHIEVYLRQPRGKWLLTHHVGMEAVCELESIGCSLPLSEVYYGIDFEPA